MKLLRRQTKRLYEQQKLKNSKLKQASATVGATLAVSSIAITSVQTAHAESAQQNFINAIGQYAQQIARENDLYASVMIAQAILESNWGTSRLATAPNYNLFGIKGHYNGQSVVMKTMEDNGKGELYQINAGFRKYPSYYESLQNYAQLLRTGAMGNSQFYAGAWKSRTNSYQDATKWLTGRYATDTKYAAKLNSIIATYGLTRYDSQITVPVSTSNSVNVLANISANGQYVVQKGDTLLAICRRYGMDLATLKAINNLTSDTIYVGQILKVAGQVSEPTTPVVKEVVKQENTVTKPEVVTTVNSGTYTVKAGDTLYRIAKNNGTTVEALKEANGLSSHLIYVNQVLRLSASQAPKQVVESQPKVSQPETVKPVVESAPQQVETKVEQSVKSVSSQSTHTVQKGDTLYRIAKNNGLTVSELMRLNGLNSALIRVGQVLTLSGQSTTTHVTQEIGVTHKVKAGDTLYRIAKNNGTTVEALKALNHLTSDLIYVNQTLKVK
ncbi:LysM peptidoglycan-binding domain-containing protein [Granulicatella sp. zg-ZJ]|uniref:LysM peptidoglycan-binding domain-containing protein n=1 Tax=Granulicatella sp. zg-ZJ TaxID=2678504 RepID=UPI0013D2157B|nr:LysM peptidoglycan-binding domain-containing protein [Granulicatella sp. zg-ZJ]NEW61768.1 LysM peptidoglycan-binding domain-containing protein [Granulicatella sp. zg-ZJ]